MQAADRIISPKHEAEALIEKFRKQVKAWACLLIAQGDCCSCPRRTWPIMSEDHSFVVGVFHESAQPSVWHRARCSGNVGTANAE